MPREITVARLFERTSYLLMKTHYKWASASFIGLATAYAALVALIYSRQEKLLFLPTKEHPLHHLFMERFGSRAFEYNMPVTPAHPPLKGWMVNAVGESDIIVIYFGGNAENIDSVLFLASNVPEVAMLSMHYRGYGMSGGTPSEEGLFKDAVRIIDHVHADFPNKKIVLFGRSLGSGVALYAAGQRPDLIEHLILTTPFDSMTAVAKRHYAWIPVNRLLRHRFDSMANVHKIKTETTIVVAGKDMYIPTVHAKRLADSLELYTKVYWREVEKADHRTIHDWNITWAYIRSALKLPL